MGQALLRHKNMSTTLTFYKKQIPAADLRAGMKLLEAEGYRYAIRLKANAVLERHVAHL